MALLQLMPHIQRIDCLTVRNYRISVSMNFSTATPRSQYIRCTPTVNFCSTSLKNNVHVEKGKFAIITNEQNAECSMHACMHSGQRIHNR